ncbi:hypothetical protein [Acinetobacter modestus]|uniref:hypothetical protein n=1 Tax=Acinetobacter modestus TaxID=1776740 RepID=UPI00301AFE4F
MILANANLTHSRVPSKFFDVPDTGEINEDDIQDRNWSLITFSELPTDTTNPVFPLNNLNLGQVTVSFDACFKGQQITEISGVADSTTIGGSPIIGQQLEFNTASGYGTIISADGANPSSPVLSGSIRFNSPISALFSKDVHAVMVDGGFFDDAGSTCIEVYSRTGEIIGRSFNKRTGIESFGFSSGKVAKIAGFSFYINAKETAGFGLDNVRIV